LITGASSGIGLELAKLFAADKSDLVLVARSHGALEKLAEELRGDYGVQVLVESNDLADAAAPQAIFDHLTAMCWSYQDSETNSGPSRFVLVRASWSEKWSSGCNPESH